MIRFKIETGGLLFSTSKTCETLIKQTHTKAQKLLEFKLLQPRETFSFKPSNNLGADSNWLIGLKSCEVDDSITEHNNKFELCTDTFDEFLFTELKDEVEEILNISDITPSHLQHEKIGPLFIECFRKLRLEKLSFDEYIILLMGYARSPFRNFESYLIIVVGLDEDDVQIVLKQDILNFVTSELGRGFFKK